MQLNNERGQFFFAWFQCIYNRSRTRYFTCDAIESCLMVETIRHLIRMHLNHIRLKYWRIVWNVSTPFITWETASRRRKTLFFAMDILILQSHSLIFSTNETLRFIELTRLRHELWLNVSVCGLQWGFGLCVTIYVLFFPFFVEKAVKTDIKGDSEIKFCIYIESKKSACIKHINARVRLWL